MATENIFMNDQKERDLQRIAEFRLLDDDFMTRVFDGALEETAHVLSIILGFRVTVLEVRTQYHMKSLSGRSARLDIYAKDGNNRRFNVEIQRSDKGAGVKRARFNSSLIDANLLNAGTKDYPLPEVYVIFITENDVMGAGLGLYHIERKILELDELFDDGEHIIYVNAQLDDDSELGRLMHDFRCKKADDMYNHDLAEKVRFFKETEKGVQVMCKLMEDMRNEAEAKGRAEGRAEQSAIFYRNCLAHGMSEEEARALSNFSADFDVQSALQTV